LPLTHVMVPPVAKTLDGRAVDAPPVLPLQLLKVIVVVIDPVSVVQVILDPAALAVPTDDKAPSVVAPITAAAPRARALRRCNNVVPPSRRSDGGFGPVWVVG